MVQEVVPTAGVVVYNKDEVLLVRHEEGSGHPTGTYGIPSGKIKANENGLEAALRKLTAETGLEAHRENLIKIPRLYTATINGKKWQKTFSLEVYVCSLFRGTIRKAPDESPEWIKILNILNDEAHFAFLPNTKQIIRDGLVYLGPLQEP
ncbi:MAG TPA: NUDIX domain-containing protein [Candidatus Nanoarchaeia archaeon]|nr:NUDIX domain-containing protein [Candidatus Nanoarchaeia archaeon]